MHGEDGDQGTWTFHKTEFVGLTLMGGAPPSATPELFGPRKAGQDGVTALAVKEAAAKKTLSKEIGFISQVHMETEDKR
jgi:hypothetical protein